MRRLRSCARRRLRVRRAARLDEVAEPTRSGVLSRAFAVAVVRGLERRAAGACARVRVRVRAGGGEEASL